jgi:hypothetical protein
MRVEIANDVKEWPQCHKSIKHAILIGESAE